METQYLQKHKKYPFVIYFSLGYHQIMFTDNIFPFRIMLCHHICHTCFVIYIDGCAGGGAVSSSCYSIHSDGVVGAWAQTLNSCSGLRSWDCELFRRAVTT